MPSLFEWGGTAVQIHEAQLSKAITFPGFGKRIIEEQEGKSLVVILSSRRTNFDQNFVSQNSETFSNPIVICTAPGHCVT